MNDNQRYYLELAEHFYALSYEALNEATLGQVRRSLINYIGGSVYTAHHQSCGELLELIESMNPAGSGRAGIWADEREFAPATAAFANAARLSSLELNDSTKSSAHPGIYVWSAALATYEQYGACAADVVRAVVFGYEVCTRMAMLSIEKIRELGLHNPGFVGALGAASAAGLLRGLTPGALCDAFGIAASLLPVCPFVSFVEGADSKDLYGGWGAYLGMFAVEAAARGLTGPRTVLAGVKALDSIFVGEAGRDVEIGKPYFIDQLNIKEFSACFAINPAVKTALALRREHALDPNDIASVLVDVYPYAYDLNEGVGRTLNTTSARLSLYYTVAYALVEGELPPAAFSDGMLKSPKYASLQQKITTRRHEEYGDGPAGIRGCIVEITLRDGKVLRGEIDAAKADHTVTPQMLRGKFEGLTREALAEAERERLYALASGLDERTDLREITRVLRGLKRADRA